MPYIQEKDRPRVLESGPETEGELNYLITYHIIKFLERRGLSYSVINEILGALDGASKEFYRRVAVPYEEHKIMVNGDVYPNVFLTKR